MRFLVDAQLPRRISHWLNSLGFNSVHTLYLPLRNTTSDTFLNELYVKEQRILISKDADFVDSFIPQGRPWKLLLISSGNIRNVELEKLLKANIEAIVEAFESGATFLELNRTTLVIHH